MAHVRSDLRAAVVTACTGLTTTGARVTTARVYPTVDTAMPCLTVNTTEETVTPQGLAAADFIERVITVEIVGLARGTSGLANTLDTIASEVETALGAGVTVQSKTIVLDYIGSDIEFSGEADKPVGRITLRFTAQLFTVSNAPGTLVHA